MILKLKSLTAPYIDSPTPSVKWFRIALAIGYTALLTLLLVQSSANPLLGPAAPRDFNLAWEILLTLAHLVGFGVLVLVNWSALATLTTSRRAVVMAVVFACLLGLVSELLQTLVSDRSASLFDLACNWGISFFMGYLIPKLYP